MRGRRPVGQEVPKALEKRGGEGMAHQIGVQRFLQWAGLGTTPVNALEEAREDGNQDGGEALRLVAQAQREQRQLV